MVPLVLFAAITSYGVWESQRHVRTLRRIPIRIHVNGTRGKSSVTRLIAGGLRAGGIRTVAKTTGTMARFIFPDGQEEDVYRVGRPNVIEQTHIMRRAADLQAQALVIECMAVMPELQPVAELRLVQSTVGVMTNVRADHLDVMGPTVDDAARALAQTMPLRGVAFTSERERASIFAEIARQRGSTLTIVSDDTVQADDMTGFPHIEHRDNVALALAVCGHLGVERDVALRGMHAAPPDPGALQRYTVVSGGKTVRFVNAFAANDPDSTRIIWTRLGLDAPIPGVERIVLANCRADRLQRSGQIAELIARGLDAEHVVLTGEGTGIVGLQAVSKYGLLPAKLTDLGGRDAEDVYEHLLGLVGEAAVIVGIGNIVGLGEDIVLHFTNRAISHG